MLPRRWFSLTGLVVGSIAPDCEYFLRMKVSSNYSHTIGGLFWFNLPLSLVLAFLFHHLVRNSLFDNLPPVLQNRLSAYKEFSWNTYFKGNWLMVCISILVGAASHLLWDSFTHEYGYFVSVLPVLAEKVNISGASLPVFKILQHTSTLIGAIVIAVALYKLPIYKMKSHRPSIRYWATLFIIAVVIVLLRLLSGLELRMYGHLIATAIAGLMLSLVFTPLCVRGIFRSGRV